MGRGRNALCVQAQGLGASEKKTNYIIQRIFFNATFNNISVIS